MKIVGINASPRKNAKSFELFHQYGASLDRKAAGNDPDLLERAKALGAGLV
jgi:hypothetical protein